MVRNNRKNERQGVVLLIVMAMLALFAAVGLAFVSYAESEASIARTAAQAETQFRADVEAELLLNHFLGQVVYDTNNVYSALYGPSLGRTLYSEDPTRNGKNGIPFNGAGVLDYSHTFGKLAGISNRRLLSKQKHDGDGFTLLPEYYSVMEDGTKRFLGGANAPWTYPGLNNPFLAAVNASGEVLLQSYYRPWVQPQPGDPAWLQKYLTFRPHKSYHPSFDDPEDGGGDVRNLPYGPGVKKPGGGYWLNDSFWMYTGFPVLTAGNGKKYTVLFAPLIMDLDNRINLMVHGNVRNGGKHASHQGWGRWEVNPSRIVDAGEMAAFISGVGRYGGNGPDTPLNPVHWWLTNFGAKAPAFHSLFNFDAVATNKLGLPASGSFSIHPTFSADWENGNAAEEAQHPAKYSYLTFGTDRPRLHASHMEPLLRGLGKGSPALTSDLFKYFPKSMASAKVRNLVTTLSHDLHRPGLVPYLTTKQEYKFNPTLGYPEGKLLDFPAPTDPAPGGDFGGTFASVMGARNRLNLNRKLDDYPPDTDLGPNGTVKGGANKVQFDTAELQRQKMAEEIYTYLILVTGAKDPNVPPNDTLVKSSDEFRAARWLAQLAVNMVDFIDNDDYATPFRWKKADPNLEYVFGTEQPRVVINEAYVHRDVDPKDPGIKPDPKDSVASQFRMSFWVELYNPFISNPAGRNVSEDGKAFLSYGNRAAYRLVLSKPDANLRSPENPTGQYDAAKVQKKFPGGPGGGNDAIVDDLRDAVVLPMPLDPKDRFKDPAQTNVGFCVIGPELTGNPKDDFFDGRDPTLKSTYQSKNMVVVAPLGVTDPPTILLQRLACPHLNHDPVTNPFITIDFVENVPVNAMETYGAAGLIATPNAIADGRSVGRRQPYSAIMVDQVTPQGASPKNTFYRQNSIENAPQVDFSLKGQTLDPSDWLTHLDRQLINPLEILHVSGYTPHLLTQKFVTGAGKFKHTDFWFNEKSLAYRLLEMVYTPDLYSGQGFMGRVPGMVNINTIWDIDTFRAICDANGLSGFKEAPGDDVKAIWDALVAYRTPGVGGIPGDQDKPFMPFSAGVSPGGPGMQYAFATGLNSTLLRELPGDPTKRLFQVPGKTHPYQQLELLTKIQNSLTTRSNVFAVWVTAGFFEVTDDTVSPPRIGREMGKDENRHLRHKFFAMVDRTEMRMRPVDGNGVDQPFALTRDSGPGLAEISGLVFNTLQGPQWTIVKDTWITINPDKPNEETVPVISTDPAKGTFQVSLTQAHFASEPIICRCWPGPWPMYDVRKDTKVVPYFTVVD